MTSCAIGTISVGILSPLGIYWLGAVSRFLVSPINSITFSQFPTSMLRFSGMNPAQYLGATCKTSPTKIPPRFMYYLKEFPYRRNDATLFRAIYARN